MVSFLIDLARGKDPVTSRVKALLEMENKSKWTVLHEAVRSGKNDIVELLMKEDPELASLPKAGTSPLYLAILLENRIIAKTLYKLSRGKSDSNDGNLSYAGPSGQNALHAAVLRGKGTHADFLMFITSRFNILFFLSRRHFCQIYILFSKW